MTPASFDFTPLLAPNQPVPAAKWSGFPKYNFIGGHNDAAHVPVDKLIAAATSVLKREGASLATYGLASGPLGYRPLREFLVGKLKGHAGITCAADDILITSGSLQGLDLVNNILLSPGDTILIEQETYGGALTRLARLGVKMVGVPLDDEGLRVDALEAALKDLQQRGVRPKYLYTIPTVQNPTGAIMGPQRRAEILKLAQAYGVPIFEDECYSDLIWDGKRPPAFYAMAQGSGVIHVGSFSKSIAPALRVGYIVAGWDVLSRILALKQDAGSGALEQMVLAEFCTAHFASHVPALTRGLRVKLDTLMEALAEQFGTAAEFEEPQGGIFLWVKLPDQVDTLKLSQAALAAGVALNPGPEWSTDKAYGKSRLRLCFANPAPETIRQGVAVLADICRREFGVPARIANVERPGAARQL
ncbi:PLP-dependent aminotransferase family protein [Reyranella sp. CPCC 100927]|uniref:aminotransferase-like domain-containing protein n=1 Tax=Reyranella sp. CPCC 100927 TaxID=2599616 RepID=UPI0011B50097|nr:PLP-dependent aminotransferase family protein [Reyranella sp. CPCC 100927]TWS97301.1 PLP-dependent aminotransferase family protein [Reyranella sp. CPCC 100927]